MLGTQGTRYRTLSTGWAVSVKSWQASAMHKKVTACERMLNVQWPQHERTQQASVIHGGVQTMAVRASDVRLGFFFSAV